jgi:hypothetical protein
LGSRRISLIAVGEAADSLAFGGLPAGGGHLGMLGRVSSLLAYLKVSVHSAERSWEKARNTAFQNS